MSTLLITNAQVVNEGKIQVLDLVIEDGRIAQIGSDLASYPAKRVIDADGKLLLPGMIDDQVHFREPGLTHKADIATESAAAVAGGITSFMEMPNTHPVTANAEALQEKYARAAQKSLANFAFYMGATNYNTEEIKRLDPKLACGLKIFMGSSTGDLVVDNFQALENAFRYSPIVVATHCEDDPTIKANLAKALAKYGEQIPIEAHPLIRSREACLKSSSLAVELAKRHGTRLHILHLTTADELALLEPGDSGHKQITGEACVHHLFFNDQDYTRLGNLIKCNPAIKTFQDQQALLQAVNDGRIDIIATDHAPHTWAEKQEKIYTKAPSGLPLVQHALLSLFEHYHKGIFTLETIVQKTAHAVAKRFQIQDRGFIREGYWADLVLVDLHKPTKVTKDTILYKCGWSPFEGYTFQSSIVMTLVNGQVVVENGKMQQGSLGMRLEFDR